MIGNGFNLNIQISCGQVYFMLCYTIEIILTFARFDLRIINLLVPRRLVARLG